MTEDPCPHGIPYMDREDRVRRGFAGCDKCDAIENAARAFRARVVSMARSVFTADAGLVPSWCFERAEAFERAADEYEKGGGK